jgi:S1-C subfamily serine protease
MFSMVAEVQARTAEEWYSIGFEQSIEGSREKAVYSYQQALRLKKNWPEVHHNLSLLFFQLKKGVEAVHHLRLAEKFYRKDLTPESKRNLQIVQRNLQKTYAEFDLNPEEFKELDSLHPVAKSLVWKVKGYGFAVEGYVLTLAHSLSGEDEVRVRFKDQPPISARVVKRYIVYDLALLKLEKEPSGFLFANSLAHQVGDTLEVPDSGGLDHPTLMKGTITGLNAIMHDKNMFELEFSSPPVPGSPLLDKVGQVAGIILSTEQIVQNFQAAGLPPEGNIALKSSYLSRIFSLYKNSLKGPRKRSAEPKRQGSLPSHSSVRQSFALAVIEGRVQENP